MSAQPKQAAHATADGEHLTVTDAAVRAKVSRNQIYALLERGALARRRVGLSQRRYIARAELDALIAERER